MSVILQLKSLAEIFYLLLMYVSLSTAAIASESTLVLNVFEDPSAKVQPEYVIEHSDQLFIAQESADLGFSDSNWWLRVDLSNSSDQQKRLAVVFDYFLMSSVDAFFVENAQLQVLRNGYSVPVAQRNFQARNIVFSVSMAPHSHKTLFIRINNEYSTHLSYHITEASGLYDYLAGSNYVLTALVTALSVLFAFILIVYLYTKDSVYGFYALYIFFALLAALGTFNVYGHFSLLSDYAITLLFAWGAILYCCIYLFIQAIFKGYLSNLTLLMHRAMIVLILIHLPLALYDAPLAMQIYAYYGSGAVISAGILWTIWDAYRQGNPLVRLIGVGFLIFLTSTGFYIASLAGFAGSEFQHGFAYGTIAEAIVFSLALAYRLRRAEEQLVQDVQELDFLAHYDGVTGLPNKDMCLNVLTEKWNSGNELRLALVNVSLNDFKYFNNTFGYLLGDELLQAAVVRLRQALREGDQLFRMPGGEFMLLLDNISSRTELMAACDKLISLFRTSLELEELSTSVQLSVGAAILESAERDAETLMRNAQFALTESKHLRTQDYCIFETEMRLKQESFLRTRDELRRAIENQEFELFYQPQLDLRSGDIIGAEGLIRWHHPEKGLIPPGQFIQIAEDSGLIVPLTRWVLQEICRQSVAWMTQGWGKFVLSANLSSVHFHAGTIEADVAFALSESGLPPEYLGLELTESAMLEHTEELLNLFKRWTSQGITLSIDDFGTGYSSLAYLSELDVQKLKIDRSFIMNYLSSRTDEAIVHSIIRLAKSLGLQTVGEGVEDPAMLGFLQELGCDTIQGFYLTPPLPAKEFECWMNSRHRNFHH